MTSTTSSTVLSYDMPNNLKDNLQYESYRLSQFGKTGSELCTGIQVYPAFTMLPVTILIYLLPVTSAWLKEKE